ncbi:hypothetical protein M2390_003001 [Mycetocola sp. BIGb0189]|uniref:hypothetical protein n=1 Tax=Mycetocola sp. BIGb0189 TaxID=2940604 RepID=UPI0021672C7A|nr:hypothetical protein [Mycetocola sp. BIGb0189]MCS4277786.1 hypothetical protein [Mycetocola sp. BIGb0189]
MFISHDGFPKPLARWRIAALSIFVLGILTGLALVTASMIIGYRTGDGQSLLVGASSLLSLGSLGAVVMLLTSRRGRGTARR